DGDLVVAGEMVGLEMVEGSSAHLDEALSRDDLGRGAAKVGVIGGERLGEARLEGAPRLEVEGVRKARDQDPNLHLVVAHGLGPRRIRSALRFPPLRTV